MHISGHPFSERMCNRTRKTPRRITGLGKVSHEEILSRPRAFQVAGGWGIV